MRVAAEGEAGAVWRGGVLERAVRGWCGAEQQDAADTICMGRRKATTCQLLPWSEER